MKDNEDIIKEFAEEFAEEYVKGQCKAYFNKLKDDFNDINEKIMPHLNSFKNESKTIMLDLLTDKNSAINRNKLQFN